MNNIQKYFDKEKQEIDKKLALHKSLTTAYLSIATVLLTFCSIFGIYIGFSINNYNKEMLENSAQFSDKMKEINKLYNEAEKLNKNIKNNFDSLKLKSNSLAKTIYAKAGLGYLYEKYEFEERIEKYEKDPSIINQYLGKALRCRINKDYINEYKYYENIYLNYRKDIDILVHLAISCCEIANEKKLEKDERIKYAQIGVNYFEKIPLSQRNDTAHVLNAWGYLLSGWADCVYDRDAREKLLESAEKKYEDASIVDKNYVNIWCNWGFLLQNRITYADEKDKLSLFEKAEEKYKEALKSHNFHFQTIINWAWLLRDKAEIMKDYSEKWILLEQARLKAQLAIEINRENPNGWLHMGWVLFEQSKLVGEREHKDYVNPDIRNYLEEGDNRKKEDLQNAAIQYLNLAVLLKQNDFEALRCLGSIRVEIAKQEKSIYRIVKLLEEADDFFNRAKLAKGKVRTKQLWCNWYDALEMYRKFITGLSKKEKVWKKQEDIFLSGINEDKNHTHLYIKYCNTLDQMINYELDIYLKALIEKKEKYCNSRK